MNKLQCIALPSVMHTGTHYVMTHLLKDFVDQGGQFAQRHTESNEKYDTFIDEVMPRHPAIVPLRHPLLNAWSWQERNKYSAPYEITAWAEQWLNLAELIEEFDPCVIPIDSPDRIDYVLEAEEVLGFSLPHDFPVKRSMGNTAGMTYKDVDKSKLEDLAYIESIIEQLEPVVNKFY